MKVNINNSVNFTAYYMNYRPTVRKLTSQSNNYENATVSMVEIDLDNKKDLSALEDISRTWESAMLMNNIYSEAYEVSQNDELKENYRFYVLTNQKSDFENLKPEEILTVCAIETENEDNAFIEYLQVKKDFKESEQYKMLGTAMVEGLKNYYSRINLYSVPSESVMDFYERNNFKHMPHSKYFFEWDRGL